MELKEFISSALVDLVKAIEDAQEKTKDTKAKIASDEKIYIVEFNISLTESESADAGGGIGVAFGSIGFKGNAKSSDSNTSQTGIKFSVPIVYPHL